MLRFIPALIFALRAVTPIHGIIRTRPHTADAPRPQMLHYV